MPRSIQSNKKPVVAEEVNRSAVDNDGTQGYCMLTLLFTSGNGCLASSILIGRSSDKQLPPTPQKFGHDIVGTRHVLFVIRHNNG